MKVIKIMSLNITDEGHAPEQIMGWLISIRDSIVSPVKYQKLVVSLHKTGHTSSCGSRPRGNISWNMAGRGTAATAMISTYSILLISSITATTLVVEQI